MDIRPNVIVGFQLRFKDSLGTLVVKRKENMVLVTYCKLIGYSICWYWLLVLSWGNTTFCYYGILSSQMILLTI